MSRLVWDKPNYNQGLDHGVYFPRNSPGESWNGLVSVVENADDSKTIAKYFDGERILAPTLTGIFGGTIETWTYPTSFYNNVITRNMAQSFGMSYRTKYDDSYRIHLVYNVLTIQSNFTYRPQSNTYSFPFTTLPSGSPEGKATSHIVIDPAVAYPETLSAIENIIYGSDSTDSRLPTVAELYSIFEETALLRVIDNNDGSCSITGPNDAVVALDSTSYSITWPTVVQKSTDTYQISSL